MVNDEKGISDPRELIVDKGRAFIPQGKDVVLPLSKGAKVYTASQTKAIMSGMGIPHYATGKDNSDAFTSAKDDWTHYTKNARSNDCTRIREVVRISREIQVERQGYCRHRGTNIQSDTETHAENEQPVKVVH